MHLSVSTYETWTTSPFKVEYSKHTSASITTHRSSILYKTITYRQSISRSKNAIQATTMVDLSNRGFANTDPGGLKSIASATTSNAHDARPIPEISITERGKELLIVSHPLNLPETLPSLTFSLQKTQRSQYASSVTCK